MEIIIIRPKVAADWLAGRQADASHADSGAAAAVVVADVATASLLLHQQHCCNNNHNCDCVCDCDGKVKGRKCLEVLLRSFRSSGGCQRGDTHQKKPWT